MRRVGQVRWPADISARYVAKGYWRDELLGDMPGRWAREYGERVALVDGDRTLTYRELSAVTDRVAVRLRELGLRDGDNVLVQMPNRWELIPLLLGCARIGVAPVLALPAFRSSEMTRLAQAAVIAAVIVPASYRGFDHEVLAWQAAAAAGGGCRVLVVDPPARPDSVSLHCAFGPDRSSSPLSPAAAGVEATLGPQDIAVLLLSGGTTSGVPKMIGRTHYDYGYNIRRMSELCHFSPRTVYLAVLPVAHNFALGCPGALGTLAAGGKVVLLPGPEPAAAFEAIRRHRVTAVAVVPAVAQRWLDEFDPERADLASLRLVQVGGARCSAETAGLLAASFGCMVQQVFGMAEGLLNCTRMDDPPDVIAQTQGRPISPDDEILIIGPDGGPGGHGELLTRGPYTPRGYFRGDAHNDGAFTADGWYRTGDVVRVHHSGNLVVEGRTRDLINRAGEKISALEVEDLALTVPVVLAAAAVPVPDPVTGERVCLCVVLRPGTQLDLKDLRTVLLDKGVAKFKLPEQLEIRAAIPLTPVGKPDKKRLLETLVQPASPEATRKA